MSTDLGAVRFFFGPHPGFAGAAIPIPQAVKTLADLLNNQRMPLREAADKIQAVTDGDVTIEDGWIGLQLGKYPNTQHKFRVIRFC